MSATIHSIQDATSFVLMARNISQPPLTNSLCKHPYQVFVSWQAPVPCSCSTLFGSQNILFSNNACWCESRKKYV